MHGLWVTLLAVDPDWELLKCWLEVRVILRLACFYLSTLKTIVSKIKNISLFVFSFQFRTNPWKFQLRFGSDFWKPIRFSFFFPHSTTIVTSINYMNQSSDQLILVYCLFPAGISCNWFEVTQDRLYGMLWPGIPVAPVYTPSVSRYITGSHGSTF